jgi:hypothetical protein
MAAKWQKTDSLGKTLPFPPGGGIYNIDIQKLE